MQHTLMYLDEVVDDVVRAARILADTKQVIESATIQSAAFSGDEELVRRLIANLLDNAVRHAPPHTTVHVQLDEQAANYVLSVSDAGDGIPPESQSHISERFFRGDVAGPRQLEGRASAWRWLAGSRGRMEEMSRWSTPHPGHDVRSGPAEPQLVEQSHLSAVHAAVIPCLVEDLGGFHEGQASDDSGGRPARDCRCGRVHGGAAGRPGKGAERRFHQRRVSQKCGMHGPSGISGQFQVADEDDDDVERKAVLAPTGVDADATGEAEVEFSRMLRPMRRSSSSFVMCRRMRRSRSSLTVRLGHRDS